MPIKFDMTDQETKATVDAWADNEIYTIQTGAGPNRHIVEVVDEEMVEEPMMEEEPVANAGPAAVTRAMGATL